MNRPLKQLQTWNAQRRLRSLAEWERTRAKGKARFVWHSALTYTLLIIPLDSYVRYFSDGQMVSLQSTVFSSRTITSALTGLFIGLISWASMEGQYRKALTEYRLAASGIEPPPRAD